MTCYEEKTDLKRTWCFLRANKNYLLQKLFWGYSA